LKVKRKTGAMSRLHLWWRSPRTRAADCYKLGSSTLWSVDDIYGHELTKRLAVQDGFWESADPLEDLLETLGRLNSMDRDEVLEWKWAEVHFGPEPGWPIDELPNYRKAPAARSVA